MEQPIDIKNTLPMRWQRAAVASSIRIALAHSTQRTLVVLAPTPDGRRAEVRVIRNGKVAGLLILPLAEDPGVFADSLRDHLTAAYPIRPLNYAQLPLSLGAALAI